MRRRALFLSAATILAAPPGKSLAGRGDPRRLKIRHAANDAVFSGSYHNGREPDAVAMRELSEVLADTRSGTVRAFDPEAIDILWELGQRQRVAEFLVLSGYRTPETNKAVHGAGDSQHLRAAALDLQIASSRFEGFSDAALRLGRGGVGLYPGQGFIHIDSGPVRRWGGAATVTAVRAAPRARSAAEIRLDQMAEAWASTRR
ncbi:YcbK family protein [Pseudoroseomonas globiformis]|uniref:Murein endopeptidase K n=1 Tax=Teichococcus globiformis TaxID=2307229 RepID=A0ABV7G793_9PROT